MDKHIKDKGAHVAKLHTRITTLRDGSAGFGEDEFSELLEIIYKHGFTTPVQFFFVEALLDAYERALSDAAGLRNSLLVGSRAILTENAELSVSV
jgi:hypothetical protein